MATTLEEKIRKILETAAFATCRLERNNAGEPLIIVKRFDLVTGLKARINANGMWIASESQGMIGTVLLIRER
jgi:hypothetical protein